MSQDEKKLYTIPSDVVNGRYGALYEYDIETKNVEVIASLGSGTYTGNNVRDNKGNIYFARHYSNTDGHLIQIDINARNSSVFLADESNGIQNLKLLQNYPNPFNNSTSIQYSLSNASWVNMKIFNITGQEIITLENEFKQSGNYQIQLTILNLLHIPEYQYWPA